MKGDPEKRQAGWQRGGWRRSGMEGVFGEMSWWLQYRPAREKAWRPIPSRRSRVTR